MEKLKLCHLAIGTYPDTKDGASKFARRIFDELKQRGHDITLLTAQWNTPFDDPNIHSIPVPGMRFLWAPQYALSYRSFLKKHEFDIIHSNGSRASLPAILASKPFLSHIHDVGPFQADFSKLPFIKWLEKWNAKKARHILTCAESNRQEIAHFMGADIDKIHTVLDAIDPMFKPCPQEAKALKEELGIKGPVLYYVGRIAFYKGVDDIIAAYKLAKKQSLS